jgi:hypothetical protein
MTGKMCSSTRANDGHSTHALSKFELILPKRPITFVDDDGMIPRHPSGTTQVHQRTWFNPTPKKEVGDPSETVT